MDRWIAVLPFTIGLLTLAMSAPISASPLGITKEAIVPPASNVEVARRGGGGAARRGGGARRSSVARHGSVSRNRTAVRRSDVRVRNGTNVRRTTVVRPGGHGAGRRWVRPARYWWRPGAAIAAGAALGYVSASTAYAWAGDPPGPDMCWYYTDDSRTQGFWDTCP